MRLNREDKRNYRVMELVEAQMALVEQQEVAGSKQVGLVLAQ
jgi:hypothetical protein